MIVLTYQFISCFIPERILIKENKTKGVRIFGEHCSIEETTKLWLAGLYLIKNLERASPMKRHEGWEKGKKPQCWVKVRNHPILPLDQTHLLASQRDFEKSIYHQICKTVHHHPRSLVPSLPQGFFEEHTAGSTGQPPLAGAFSVCLPGSSLWLIWVNHKKDTKLFK